MTLPLKSLIFEGWLMEHRVRLKVHEKCALDSAASGLSLRPGWGHCVVFLSKTLYSHGASLRPGV